MEQVSVLSLLKIRLFISHSRIFDHGCLICSPAAVNGFLTCLTATSIDISGRANKQLVGVHHKWHIK